jgi:hypothetical protein
MDTKKLVAGVALAGTVVLGTTGVAFAADGSGTGSGSGGTSNSTTAPAKGHPRIRQAVRRGALKEVLSLTKTTPQELRDALKGGDTIARFANDHGVTTDQLTQDLTSKADAAIQKAVTNGKLSSTQASKLTSKVPGAVDKFINRTWGQGANAGQNAPAQPTT